MNVGALAVFAFVSSITPGPNNVMLWGSGLNFGFRSTLRHIAGVTIGFVSLLAATTLGLGAVFPNRTWALDGPADRRIRLPVVPRLSRRHRGKSRGRLDAEALHISGGDGLPVREPESLGDGRYRRRCVSSAGSVAHHRHDHIRVRLRHHHPTVHLHLGSRRKCHRPAPHERPATPGHQRIPRPAARRDGIPELEVTLNYIGLDLVKAIQEDRLEEARRARLARSVTQGRRRDTLERVRVSGRRALGRLSRKKCACVCPLHESFGLRS